jgi:hypothetical protein
MTENPPKYTAAEYYGFFMTGLMGLVDDAELSGYDARGTELLRQARVIFWREFRERHPGHWDRNSN